MHTVSQHLSVCNVWTTSPLLLMKILSHPGHGTSVTYHRRLDLFQFVEDISPLIQETSSVLSEQETGLVLVLCRHFTSHPRSYFMHSFFIEEAFWMRGETSYKKLKQVQFLVLRELKKCLWWEVKRLQQTEVQLSTIQHLHSHFLVILCFMWTSFAFCAY